MRAGGQTGRRVFFTCDAPPDPHHAATRAILPLCRRADDGGCWLLDGNNISYTYARTSFACFFTYHVSCTKSVFSIIWWYTWSVGAHQQTQSECCVGATAQAITQQNGSACVCSVPPSSRHIGQLRHKREQKMGKTFACMQEALGCVGMQKGRRFLTSNDVLSRMNAYNFALLSSKWPGNKIYICDMRFIEVVSYVGKINKKYRDFFHVCYCKL